MRQAVAQAKLCIPSTSAYSVGALLVQHLPPPPHSVSSPPASLDAVIASHYAVVATGYSRELGSNTHAEECCLIKYQQSTQPATPSSSAASASLPSAFSPLQGEHWLYTTMEPCSRRLSGRTSCSAHLLVSHVKRVVIGALEPDVFVSDCQGRAALEAAGVTVKLMPELQAECLQPNAHLLQQVSDTQYSTAAVILCLCPS